MSRRIETQTSKDSQDYKFSQNETSKVVGAGVDIGSDEGVGGSNVSVDQVVTEGREVAGVTVNGERTPILVPNEGAFVQSDWDEQDTSADAYIKNKPNLANVATSGDYSDLQNTPDLTDFVVDANYVHTDNNYNNGSKAIVDGVTSALAGKVDKVSGKDLSDNNYTNTDKAKLTNLKDIYAIGDNLTLDPNTNTLSADAQSITVDSAMSSTSENPVQNKVITAALGDKVDKVNGKGLSTEDYTTSEKNKLAGIDQNAQVNVIETISVNSTAVSPDVNKNVDISVPYDFDDLNDRPTKEVTSIPSICTPLPIPSPVTYGGFTPIGTVIAVMGNSAPRNYLVCDGTVYNITDYPELAGYFEAQFGSKNYFGGDGTTTFAVPDLQGEFLRGSGTNSHADQGDGATVGTHQDGTEVPDIFIQVSNSSASKGFINGYTLSSASAGSINRIAKPDATLEGTGYSKYQDGNAVNLSTSSVNKSYAYTSRPTNTSVLYCISVKNIYMDAASVYSEEEKVIGQWIDGKPLYQKTVIGVCPSTSKDGTLVNGKLSNDPLTDLDTIVSIQGVLVYTPSGNTMPLPWTTGGGYIIQAVIDGTDKCVYIGTKASSYNGMPVRVTVQYTKTTD